MDLHTFHSIRARTKFRKSFLACCPAAKQSLVCLYPNMSIYRQWRNVLLQPNNLCAVMDKCNKTNLLPFVSPAPQGSLKPHYIDFPWNICSKAGTAPRRPWSIQSVREKQTVIWAVYWMTESCRVVFFYFSWRTATHYYKQTHTHRPHEMNRPVAA